ncbi:MAG TPA: MBL fold metallo-hydrolase [Acidobacteriota bacterium]|jgi:glyoxylase-like metal-dependent hydrolase (beta-lactamase superfamily II)
MHKQIMRGKILIAVVFTCVIFAAATQDAKGILETTLKNLGDVRSIQYAGSGAVFTLGQNVSPPSAWPRVEIKSFTRTVDYERQAMRTEAAGVQGPVAMQFLAGGKAWGQSGSNITPASPAATADRQLQIWLTPHGFLKGALANNARVKRGKVTLVTFTAPGNYRVTGTISADHLVEKVESALDNPVLGDMRVETIYSDYRDFGGFRFPAKMVQKQGGFPVFEFTVTAAQANVPLDVTIPDSVRQAATPPVSVASQKLADGVWYLTGGSHHSVAVEFADHVAVIEAPQNEERSIAVIAEVKKLIPGKPIRYLINTHHHFDHSGGLRTYVAEGATIVTHQINKPFYQKTFKAPHTIAPDRQSRARKNPKIVTVGAKHVLSDKTRTLEIHHIQGNSHNEGILMAWLPKEKLLVEVDVYTPLAPNAPPPATPSPAAVNLYENIERLNLAVDQIAPLHGRLVTLADLKKTIGK